MPSLSCIFLSSSCISLRIFKSSAPRGSSSINISGSFTSALAIAIRCCCPPERVDIFLSSKPSRSTIERTLLTFFLITSFGSFLSLSPKAILSYIFICGKRAYRWNTVLIGLLLAGSCDISSPLRSICPLVGISNPAIILNVVVFPHPDGPRNVTNSPRLTCRLKLSTALKPLSSYTLHISFSSIMFSDLPLSAIAPLSIPSMHNK